MVWLFCVHFFFFFSSRRRHTSCSRDWSSDVCSSDLWQGASGVAFLTETASRVRAAGYEIANVAVQLIGNRPRFAQRRTEAESVLSAVVGAPVSVSATTSDGLGLTGR